MSELPARPARPRCFADHYGDEEPETVRRYRRMLGETLPEGYTRCCAAIRE